MITEENLYEITTYLKKNVFQNPDVMFAEDPEPEKGDRFYDLVTIIASLHNVLYETVTGQRYDYMHHWANKIGANVDEHFFDDMLKEEVRLS